MSKKVHIAALLLLFSLSAKAQICKPVVLLDGTVSRDSSVKVFATDGRDTLTCRTNSITKRYLMVLKPYKRYEVWVEGGQKRRIETDLDPKRIKVDF